MPRSLLIVDMRNALRRSVGVTASDMTDVEANGYIQDGCGWLNLDLNPVGTGYFVSGETTSSAAISPSLPDAQYFELLLCNTVGRYLHPKILKAAESALNMNTPSGHLDTRNIVTALMATFKMHMVTAQRAAQQIIGRKRKTQAVAVDFRTANPNRRVYSPPPNFGEYREDSLQITNAYASATSILDDWGWRDIGTWPSVSTRV